MPSILYLASARLPTEKAHGIQIMKMCEAWAESGCQVELVLPWRFNHIKGDAFTYYGVKRNFVIKKLPAMDLVGLGKIGYWLFSLSFSLSALVYVLMKKFDVIYSRDEWPLFAASLAEENIYWEAHIGQANLLARAVLRRARGVVVITAGLKKLYEDKFKLAAGKILVAPDGVDVEKFSITLSQEECRKKLNLPLDKKLIIYTGHLYDWKGVQVLADAALTLPENVLVVFVGGTQKDITAFKLKNKGNKNIMILGQKPYQDMPYYLQAADVLVLPNSGKSQVSAAYTSPLKLFEYMAAGRQIVAADLPSIKEILSPDEATFFTPDKAQSLAAAIISLLDSGLELSKSLIYVKNKAQKYSWLSRARQIILFFKQQA